MLFEMYYYSSGTAGERCEVNVNDCVPGACSEFGLCVDHLSGFSCACIWPYSGNRWVINEL